MFDIIIPTFDREKKLQRCINGILSQDFKDWRLVVTYDARHEFVFKIWNREIPKTVGDWVIPICDDTEFYPDALEKLVKLCNEKFPDTDGLIGMNQVGIPPDAEGYSKSAQVAIGRKFIERFNGYPVYCPDYISFGADAELGHFARSIDKFYFAEEIKMTHYHPCHFPEEMDETHRINRANNRVEIDNGKLVERIYKRGWTWGKDWNLLCS